MSAATATLPARRTNGVANTAVGGLSLLLEQKKDSIKAILPKHMTPERVMKLASVALGKTPLLQKCTIMSLYTAVLKSAELGLDCSGTLGSAYLVPFKRKFKDASGRWQEEYECTLIIGYRGLIDLARRSNQISSIEARVVYANDHFDLSYGSEGKLIHKPMIDDDPGEFRLVYGVAHLVGGGVQTEVMTRTAIDKIRDSSKGYYKPDPKGPWVDHYEEMARKTVIRRLCKYLPMSVEVQNAISAEEEVYEPETPQFPRAASDLNQALQEETTDMQGGYVVEQQSHNEDDSQLPDNERVDTATGEVVAQGEKQNPAPANEEDEILLKELAESLTGDWPAIERRLRKDFISLAEGRTAQEFTKLQKQELGIVPENSKPEDRARFAMKLATSRAQ